MSESVLVVAAHPDDEVLGCGGTIARHSEAGDEVHTLFLADGVAARGASGAALEAEKAQRAEAAARAARVLDSQPPRFLGLPDNRLDSVPLLDVVQGIESAIAEIDPVVVYTHHGGDLNIDHEIAHRATVTACRPLPDARVRALYAFEIVSSTEWCGAAARAFLPDRFVGIDATLERKIEALGCYAAEMRPAPHARSVDNVRALAAFRGASAGLPTAEAFMTIREVLR